ncbi:hypothetical protein BCR34DRAFT_287071 [Clohesyomyces aquaticus]|uniref:Uncharacterized protein n=1 Tax=Clohesyomyces aquaticus TaxID=1231657 RepID=A0A1Y1ZRK2_9PLEO|nr:hypothetical protein BCR34DRAFT_287071 [Clohesyomyces aquaticus]
MYSSGPWGNKALPPMTHVCPRDSGQWGQNETVEWPRLNWLSKIVMAVEDRNGCSLSCLSKKSTPMAHVLPLEPSNKRRKPRTMTGQKCFREQGMALCFSCLSKKNLREGSMSFPWPLGNEILRLENDDQTKFISRHWMAFCFPRLSQNYGELAWVLLVSARQ